MHAIDPGSVQGSGPRRRDRSFVIQWANKTRRFLGHRALDPSPILALKPFKMCFFPTQHILCTGPIQSRDASPVKPCVFVSFIQIQNHSPRAYFIFHHPHSSLRHINTYIYVYKYIWECGFRRGASAADNLNARKRSFNAFRFHPEESRERINRRWP